MRGNQSDLTSTFLRKQRKGRSVCSCNGFGSRQALDYGSFGCPGRKDFSLLFLTSYRFVVSGCRDTDPIRSTVTNEVGWWIFPGSRVALEKCYKRPSRFSSYLSPEYLSPYSAEGSSCWQYLPCSDCSAFSLSFIIQANCWYSVTP